MIDKRATKSIHLVGGLFLLALVAGCRDTSRFDIDAPVEIQFVEMARADPGVDYLDALDNENLRFVTAVSTMPGLSECLIREFGVDHIVPLTDAYIGFRRLQLQALAELYAEKYNTYLLQYIESNRLTNCPPPVYDYPLSCEKTEDSGTSSETWTPIDTNS